MIECPECHRQVDESTMVKYVYAGKDTQCCKDCWSESGSLP